MPKRPKENAHARIKRLMRMWERRVRDAVRRANKRGEAWYYRSHWDWTRRDYWSAHISAMKAGDRLEERGTIRFLSMRGNRSGFVGRDYTLNPGRTKVVKATKRKARR